MSLFWGTAKILTRGQETDREKSVLKKKFWNKVIGKMLKQKKTREIKYFINFTKFCFSYKKLTEKKTHFIILQYQNSNPH